ncbi:MAG: MGMT family protein [Anaerolineae bacterium]|nr:MGMT family protein [Anaerolineae bacterium]
MSSDLYERVYRIVATIPAGRVLTYGDIARMLGRPRGGRLVGWAMRHCPEGLPWYRVVNAQGRLSVTARYPDGRLMQQALLEEEGVVFDAEGRLDVGRYAWTGGEG